MTRTEKELTKSAEATIKRIKEQPVITIAAATIIKEEQEVIDSCTRSSVLRDIHNASNKFYFLSRTDISEEYDTFIRTATDEQKDKARRNLAIAQEAINALEAKLNEGGHT